MKRSGFVFLALSLLFVVATAQANMSFTLTAKIPFAFSVGTASLPAGEYLVQQQANGLLAIRGDGSSSCVTITNTGRTASGTSEGARLVFHRYNEQYFLSEVFGGGGGQAQTLPVSRQEKEYLQSGMKKVAENSRQPEVLVIRAAVATH